MEEREKEEKRRKKQKQKNKKQKNSFSIKIDSALDTIQQLCEEGRVVRPWIGLPSTNQKKI